MKIIDILNKMANGTLENGFKFEYGKTKYRYNKSTNEILDTKDSWIGENISIEQCLSDEVEVIEENREIEELHILDEGDSNKALYEYCSKILTKQNELVRAVNKINKQLEELETSSEISEEEINDAIKRAREYKEREEK